MAWDEYATENSIRNGSVRILDAIRNVIMYFKWYRPMMKIKDPEQRLQKKLLFELSGVRYGGMAMSGAYVSFKQDYYDNFASNDERTEIRRALLRMLRSPKYGVPLKQMIAFVCSDLGMIEAAADIALVREAAARDMTMRQLYRFKQEQEREREKHKLASLDSRFRGNDGVRAL